MSTSNPYGTVTVMSPPPYRGGPQEPVAALTFPMQSMTAQWSWGSSPGSATVTYDENAVPVGVGWYVQLVCGGHVLNGVCIDDVPTQSSSGNRRILTFNDNRYWLAKDQVRCSFNRLDDKIVNNVRVKRYVHHLPDLFYNVSLNPAAFQVNDAQPNPDAFLYDANENLVAPNFAAGPYYPGGGIKTYTTVPLTAAQIIILILNSQTVRDAWSVSFHPDMFTNPVWDIDATGGKSLASILQEISDQQGLVFSNLGGEFNLVWVRKGTWDARYPNPILFLPPAETNPSTGEQQQLLDDVVQGEAISENPTNILILGDRNIYMPLNIPMVPDWSPGWDQFWNLEFFVRDIYNNGSTQFPITILGQSWPAGTPFTAIGSSPQDKEQIVARQLARAYALDITVGQYATLKGETLFVDTPNFADYRKYAGRTRLDMPCALYIQRILLRAFRFPDGFTITNWTGVNVPLDSMEIVDKMIARVTFDGVTGIMSANPNLAADGNGLAIVQGYQVGQGMFEKLNPDRFNLQAWITQTTTSWQACQFEIDDSGEPDGKFIIFDGPIYKSATFFATQPWMNGYTVVNVQPTKTDTTVGLDTPAVQCCLCFAAERFQYFKTGAINAGATETYPIGGLNREAVFAYGTTQWAEVLFSDGLTANQKAQLFIEPLLLNQFIYDKGGYRHALVPDAKGNFPTATGLNPIIDTIKVELSPGGGIVEEGNFTTEYPRMVFTPERDLDRNIKLKTLLPGQAQLRNEALLDKQLASALAQQPGLLATMSHAFKGVIGMDDPQNSVPVLSPATPPANQNLNAGTPLWSMPGTANSNGTRSNTVAVPPTATTPTAQHSIFRGVTMQHNWPAGDGAEVPAQSNGTIYARVMGPVQVGAPVGQVVASGGSVIPDYLSPNSTNFIGTAQEAIATATVMLIRVQVGSTVAAEGTYPFEIQKVSETQVKINPQSALLSGLDIFDQVQIFGLDVPFTVTNGTLIYLEVLFDVNNEAIFANIATAGASQVPVTGGAAIPARTGWRTESAFSYTSPSGYPSLVGTIDNNNPTGEGGLLATEMDFWVEPGILGANNVPQNQIDAQAALRLFTPGNLPARYNQFYAYVLIGFCTNSAGADGITLNGAGTNTSFTIVQCVETDLMLQGFCSGGVPSQLPVPYSGPHILPLPAPTISAATAAGVAATIVMPTGYTSAVIWYTLDGGTLKQYTSPISVTAAGTHIITAFAKEAGFFDSPTASGQFTI